MPRQTLRQFLLLGKSTIQKAIRESQMITFVIGNEAAGISILYLIPFVENACQLPC